MLPQLLPFNRIAHKLKVTLPLTSGQGQKIYFWHRLSKFAVPLRYSIKQQKTMKNYALIFRGGMDFATASPDDIQNAMLKWKTWMDKLAEDGRYIPGGHRLGGPAAVVTGSQRLVTDGPFTEGKEVVGGFIAIKAADLDEAVMIAKGCPIQEFDGSTEVREVASM